jgi:hypothetical protein
MVYDMGRGCRNMTLNWLEILNQVDMIGLSAMGAPADEYATEARILNENAEAFNSEEELCLFLRKISKDTWFSLAPDDNLVYEDAARRIWAMLHQSDLV